MLTIGPDIGIGIAHIRMPQSSLMVKNKSQIESHRE